MTKPLESRPYFGALPLFRRCSYAAALLAACTASDGGVTPTAGIAGSWETKGGTQTATISVQLAEAASVLSGTGTARVPALAPISGPATPAYTGDNFTITSGSFNSPNVQFTATLGANSDATGGVYRGTLSFSGTLTSGTMSGTLTFTPPRTVTQVFAGQTVSGMTLVKL